MIYLRIPFNKQSGQSDAVTQLAGCQPHYFQTLLMSQDTRILNISRNTRLKPHQAERRIAEGLAVWVNPGESIRDANLKEVLEHRAVMARAEATRQLEAAELPGLVYRPSESAREGEKMYRGCLVAAREFALSCN